MSTDRLNYWEKYDRLDNESDAKRFQEQVEMAIARYRFLKESEGED